MTPFEDDQARHQRITELFNRARQLEGSARELLLAETDRSDPEAAREVRELLAADTDLGALRSDALAALAGDPEDALPRFATGDTIEEFELVRPLGRGGMGQVWLAHNRSTGGQVALKLLPTGHVQREVMAAGRLRHPGIVQVHQTGTGDGFAWISMEYVDEGRTLRDLIREWREEGTFSVERDRAIAALVAKVARALQAAHDAGTLHLDVKPANILLTPDGEPKLTDFGIARALDNVEATRTSDSWRTPAYASPEQAAGRRNEVDQRSEVFSLGVVLYELLAHQRPFLGDSAAAVTHNILTEDPPDLRRSRPGLARDLAVIANKAMERRTANRYASTAELGDELERYLNNEPIVAAAPGPLIRASKWARRHKVVSTGIGIGSIALSIVSVSLYFALSANEANELLTQALTLETQQLNQERVRLGNVISYQKDLLDGLNPADLGRLLEDELGALLVETSWSRGASADSSDPSRQDLFEGGELSLTHLAAKALSTQVGRPAIERARRMYATDPLTSAMLEAQGASVLSRLGMHIEARQSWQNTVETLSQHLGRSHIATLEAREALGSNLLDLGDVPGALEAYRSAHHDAVLAHGVDSEASISLSDSMGTALLAAGRDEEAVSYASEALDSARRSLGNDDPMTQSLVLHLGIAHSSISRFEEALPHLEEYTEWCLRQQGDSGRDTALGLLHLGLCQIRLLQSSVGTSNLERAILMGRRHFGSTHPTVLRARANLAVARAEGGAFTESILEMRRVLDRTRSQALEGGRWTMEAEGQLADILFESGRQDEALQILDSLITDPPPLLDLGSPYYFYEMARVGRHRMRAEDYEGAQGILESAVSGLTRELGADHIWTLDASISLQCTHLALDAASEDLDALIGDIEKLGLVAADHGSAKASCFFRAGVALRLAQDYEHAQSMLERCLEIRESMPVATVSLSGTLNALATVHFETENFAEAEDCIRRALEVNAELGIDGEARALPFLANLGSILVATGRFESGLEVLDEAATTAIQVYGPDSANAGRRLLAWGQALETASRPAEAESKYRMALTNLRGTLGAADDHTRACLFSLGLLLSAQGSHVEAIALLEEELDACRTALGPTHQQTLEGAANLIAYYYKLDATKEAEALALALDADLGASPPTVTADLLTVEFELGYTLILLGHPERGIEVLERELSGCKALHGPTSVEALSSLNNLASLHWELDEIAKSRACFEELVDGLEATREPGDVVLANTRANLGLVLVELDRPGEAKAHLERAIDVLANLPDSDPAMLTELESTLDDIEREVLR